jgi:hypothetical protein
MNDLNAGLNEATNQYENAKAAGNDYDARLAMNSMAGYRSAIANLEQLGNRAWTAQQVAALQQQNAAAQYGAERDKVLGIEGTNTPMDNYLRQRYDYARGLANQGINVLKPGDPLPGRGR